MQHDSLPNRSERIDSRRIGQTAHFQPRCNPMQKMKSLSLHPSSRRQPGNQGMADQLDHSSSSPNPLNDDIPLLWPVLRKIAAHQFFRRCPEAARLGLPDGDPDLGGEAIYRWKMIHFAQEQFRLLGRHLEAGMAGPGKNLCLRNLDRERII